MTFFQILDSLLLQPLQLLFEVVYVNANRVLLDGNTPCTDKPVFFTGIDTRLHDQKDYVDRMSANVAVANVGTSKLTGAELLTEAYMASALLDTITTPRGLNMDKPGRKKPEKVA